METATITNTTDTAISVVLPLNQAKQLASLIAFAAAGQDAKLTPALSVVKVVFSKSGITGIATDRYVAAKLVLDTPCDSEGIVYLDAAAAKFISARKTGLIGITYSGLDESLTITDYEASITGKNYSGNFPAVETLIDGAKPGSFTEASFRIDLLAKLGKLIGSDGKKVERFLFQASEQSNPNRPSPVIASAEGYTAIIQPNLLPKA